MIYFLFIIFILSLGYVVLILYYLSGWNETRERKTQQHGNKVKVSIIVPARNEEKNIGRLIDSLLAQDYDKKNLEFIIINDNSEDGTQKVINAYKEKRLKSFNLKDLIPDYEIQSAYKKRAIEQAVIKASGELIITTDADCVVPTTWVSAIVSAYEIDKPKLIAGPVLFEHDDSFFQQFQSLDFMSMIGITAASIKKGMFNLANGANLAYQKEAFLEVNGYQDIDKNASGDDMFLIYKIAKHFKNEVLFLKDKAAIVKTQPNQNIHEFLQQRFRWTSKSFAYQDKRITIILAWVYLFNLFLVAGFFLMVAGLLYWRVYLTILILKAAVDYGFLRKVTRFFGEEKIIKIFFLSEIIHVVYIVSVGSLGNFIPSNWKGRKIK